MNIYQKFCTEITDESGKLKKLTLDYPDNFNFGYDVVDVMAEHMPDKRAIVWCNTENEEHIFTFADVKNTATKWQMCLRRRELKGETELCSYLNAITNTGLRR